VLLDDLRHHLIVSCQPVPGGPMDSADCVVAFALAALAGGARGLRIESVPYVVAVRPRTAAPLIGIVKQDRADSAVRITPLVEQVTGLIDAGADIVAVDATRRPRPVPVRELIAAIKARGRLAMADCADLDDAREALAAGADIVGTTLSGYTGGPEPVAPDFELITAMRALTPHVMAEGRLRSPEQAAEAIRRGAWCVTVGSALTRTEHATGWFREAVERAVPAGQPVLAIDIGGTKIAAGIVEGAKLRDEVVVPTDRAAGPDGWIAALAERLRGRIGGAEAVAAAVTGLAIDGRWSPLNPATLPLPMDYPLAERLSAVFGLPAVIVNDAQAAAWGEYRFGAGQGADMELLTISTGIGGGRVLGGRPRLGLAGHFGQLRLPSGDGASPLEDAVSGRWIAAEAPLAGQPAAARAVVAAAGQGEPWADGIVAASARKVALLCHDLHFAFDPARIVIGGGIGLAAGYLDRVRAALPELRARLTPTIVPAQLGAHAGLVGIADLAGNRDILEGRNGTC
jgi:N-acetylmannosamine-6-phosphate 2-epimerase/N-acetylmannosamine kinase